MIHEIFKGMDNAAEQINENFQGLAFETGSNEYGRWKKYADGTLEVFFSAPFNSVPINIPTGGMYRSEVIGFDYPVPFIEPPAVSLNLKGNTLMFPGSTNSAGGANGATLYVIKTTSVTTDLIVMGSALGRWK